MRFLTSLLARLPFWALYRLADFLFLVAYYVMHHRYSIVMDNLKRSFPEKSPAELKKIARNFFLNLADVVVETIKLYHISKASLRKRVHFTNPEIIENYGRQGQTMLMMASHQCNWEWQLVGVQAFFDIKTDAVYQQLSNKTINEIMLRIRGRFGYAPIPAQSAVREVIRRRGDTFIIGLAADQTPMRNDNNFRVQFLNQSTPFFMGTARMAELTQAPVLYAAMKRVRRGHYSMTFHELACPPHEKGSNEVIIRYAELLEKGIRECPSDWLWSHRRWKYA